MTDKQLPPDWAVAKAVEYFNQSPKHHPLHRVLLDDIYSKARELSAEQPESAAHQYIKQVVAKDMEKVYKALGRVQPSYSDAEDGVLPDYWLYPERYAFITAAAKQNAPHLYEHYTVPAYKQPDATRGGRPIKVLGQNGEPYPTTLVGATFEQPALDGDALLREVCAEMAALGCGPCVGSMAPWEDLHGRIAAYLSGKPQPADGVVEYELSLRLRKHAVIQRRRRLPENAKLADEAADAIQSLILTAYINPRPMRGVEVDEAMAEKFIAHLDESSGVYLEGSGLNATNVIAAWKAALSGVQR